MASEQFIVDLYSKLHGGDHKKLREMTGAEVKEILAIVDDKHKITLSNEWINDRADIDLRVLRNVMVSASLNCHARLASLNEQKISDFTDEEGEIQKSSLQEWSDNLEYYQEQRKAIKAIEVLLDALRDATFDPEFYMRGIDV